MRNRVGSVGARASKYSRLDEDRGNPNATASPRNECFQSAARRPLHTQGAPAPQGARQGLEPGRSALRGARQLGPEKAHTATTPPAAYFFLTW
jgi:hypothetical protein